MSPILKIKILFREDILIYRRSIDNIHNKKN